MLILFNPIQPLRQPELTPRMGIHPHALARHTPRARQLASPAPHTCTAVLVPCSKQQVASILHKGLGECGECAHMRRCVLVEQPSPLHVVDEATEGHQNAHVDFIVEALHNSLQAK